MLADRAIPPPQRLKREIGQGSALALNMLEMVGVGPFITLPLIVAAMGGPQAMLGWVLGAALALCDGLVWAELAAALPEAGGSYAFLREIYGPGRLGRLVSFLYVWQFTLSAPLVMASGAIGLSQYATFLFPWLSGTLAGGGPLRHIERTSLLAVAVVVLSVALLYRQLRAISGWPGFSGPASSSRWASPSSPDSRTFMRGWRSHFRPAPFNWTIASSSDSAQPC